MYIFALKKKILFFQQFAALLKSGLGLLPTLEHLQRQSLGATLPVIINEFKTAAQQGQQLSVIFKKYELYFGKFPVALIRSGEASGHLPENAQVIADYLEDLHKSISRLLVGLAYPVILLHLFIFIIPAATFVTSGPLAYFTQVFTKFLFLYGSGAILYFIYYIGKTQFKPLYDQVKLWPPVSGKLLKNLSLYKFIRGFAALYQSGLNTIESWQIASELTDNDFLQTRLLQAKRVLEQGRPVTQAFQAAGIFSEELIAMVSTGEAGGNIDGMLIKAAEYLGEVNQRTLQILMRLLPVLAYLVIAGIIAYNIITGYLHYWSEIDKVLN